MTVEQFAPKARKKSANSNESQTTTLNIPSKMIEEQYARALSLLKENEEKLTQLAEKLLSKEVIFKEDLELIFGKRIWDETGEENPESQESAEDKKGQDTSKEDKKEVDEKDLRTPPEFKSNPEDSDNQKESKDE